MRMLKLQVQTTVDGFVAGPEGQMDFMVWDWDDALKRYTETLTAPVDGILLGRKLAEGFIPYWAAAAADPDDPEHEAGVKFSDTPKIVFSRTLDESPWPGAELARGDLVEEVKALKSRLGGDLITYGGADFASELIAHDLVDDLHLFVNPTAIGEGMPIFRRGGRRDLTLVEAHPFACGIVVLHYRPRR